MTDLDPKFFQGNRDIPHELCQKLEVDNLLAKGNQALVSMGWEGQLVSVVGLTLNSDGTLVHNARFMMRGALCTGMIPVKISNIWEGASKDVFLNLVLPDAGEFQFSGGELYSEYLAQAKVKFS